MSDERPEALLKSALEKIVYFEARSEHLQNDLRQARSELSRHQAELSAAASREISMRQQVAELEVRVSRAESERDEQRRMNEALRTERAALIGKLIEASRIHQADGDGIGDFDLASFISELRSEVLAGRTQTAAAPVEPPPPVSRGSVTDHAERLLGEGRLHVSTDQVIELSQASGAPKEADTLFGASVKELSALDSNARVRAAKRLKTLANPAAAPAIATALHSEKDPKVLVALLDAFADLAHAEGAPIVEKLRESMDPEVRVAALKALISLEPSSAAPHLSAAMKDPDRAVRRRASLLALDLSGDSALRLGEQAARDSDGEVRSLAALVLGASGGERARSLLLTALRDDDTKVRQSASQSLSRLLGTDVSFVVGMDDLQRRREIRRLSSLPIRPATLGHEPAVHPEQAKRAPPVHPEQARRVPAVHPEQAKRAPPVHPEQAKRAPPVHPEQARRAPPVHPERREAESRGPHAPARTRTAVVEAVAAPAVTAQAPVYADVEVPEALCTALLGDIRCALRGMSESDLVSSSGAPQARVAMACELLVARGLVVRRGLKYFAA